MSLKADLMPTRLHGALSAWILKQLYDVSTIIIIFIYSCKNWGMGWPWYLPKAIQSPMLPKSYGKERWFSFFLGTSYTSFVFILPYKKVYFPYLCFLKSFSSFKALDNHFLYYDQIITSPCSESNPLLFKISFINSSLLHIFMFLLHWYSLYLLQYKCGWQLVLNGAVFKALITSLKYELDLGGNLEFLLIL